MLNHTPVFAKAMFFSTSGCDPWIDCEITLVSLKIQHTLERKKSRIEKMCSPYKKDRYCFMKRFRFTFTSMCVVVSDMKYILS